MTVFGLKNSHIAIEQNHVISFVEIPVLMIGVQKDIR